MKVLGWVLLQMLLLSNLFNTNRSANVFLKRYENCDLKVSYDLIINVTIKTVTNKQYLDGALILKSPLDNALKTNLSVEIFNGKSYTYLFSVNENKACERLQKYMGEFLYTLERNCQLIPGMCPIPKGTHRMHNAPLNFEQFSTAAMFPFGDLRIIFAMSDKQNNIYTCVLIDAEHNY